MSEISDSSDVVTVKRGKNTVALSLVASQSTSTVSAGPSGSEAIKSATAREDDENPASRGGACSGDRRRSSTAPLEVEKSIAHQSEALEYRAVCVRCVHPRALGRLPHSQLCPLLAYRPQLQGPGPHWGVCDWNRHGLGLHGWTSRCLSL